MNATQLMEQKASSGGMTPDEAAEFLRENSDLFRTFLEKIKRYVDRNEDEGEDAFKRRLRGKLLEGLWQDHPQKTKESQERKVRMWLNSPTDFALDRETVLELAFILKLTTEQADSFLALMTDEGFRWRDPDEIVAVYALNHGMDYPEARELRKWIGTVDMKADTARDLDENLTNLVREEVMNLQTKEELRTYLAENGAKFGRLRNHAGQLFESYMNRLKNPVPDRGMQEAGQTKDLEEQSMSTFAILRTYLHQEMIPTGEDRRELLQDSRITKAQKEMFSNILAAWPDETSLRRIENRAASVGRKTMILLFIALDEDPEEDEDDFEDGEEEKGQGLFESRRSRLNVMLTGCGYRPLDARNPFDWMILYAISVDDLFDLDNTLDEFLTEVFGGN